MRATLGSEPSSGYAFHDKEIVERIRPARGNPATPQTASHAPRERSFDHTLAGGLRIQDVVATPSVGALQSANDQHGSENAHQSLPSIPEHLVAAVPEQAPAPTNVSTKPSDAPAGKTSSSSAPPSALVGGAIWQALPSVVIDSQVVHSNHAVANHQPAGTGIDSVALPYRPSAADIEAEQAQAYGDPRVVRFEKLVERGAWEQLRNELAEEAAPTPALRLLALVARRETLEPQDKQGSAELSEQAIATVASILKVPENSATALVLAKRLIRKNPVWMRSQPASSGLSVAVLMGGIALGGGIGWLLTRLLF